MKLEQEKNELEQMKLEKFNQKSQIDRLEKEMTELKWKTQKTVNDVQTKQNLTNEVLLKLVDDDEFKNLLEKYVKDKKD